MDTPILLPWQRVFHKAALHESEARGGGGGGYQSPYKILRVFETHLFLISQ